MKIYSFWLKNPVYHLKKAEVVLPKEKKEYRQQFANAFGSLLLGALEEQKTSSVFTLQYPSIYLPSYLNRFLEYATPEVNIYIVALIYLDRYLAYSHLELNLLNVHQLLACSLHEAYYRFSNKERLISDHAFVRIAGINLKRLDILKLNYNCSLHLDFSVNVNTLNQYAKIFDYWNTLESLSSLGTFERKEHKELANVFANYLSISIMAEKEQTILKANEEIDLFSSTELPTTSLFNYLSYFIQYLTKEESMTLMIIMLIYLDRYLERSGQFLTFYNVHKLCAISLIAAHKFYDESFFSLTQSYSQIAVLPAKEFFLLEKTFYGNLNYQLSVEEKTFELYSNKVKTLFSNPNFSEEESNEHHSNVMII